MTIVRCFAFRLVFMSAEYRWPFGSAFLQPHWLRLSPAIETPSPGYIDVLRLSKTAYNRLCLES